MINPLALITTPTLELSVGGFTYNNFVSLSIQKSVENIASGINFEFLGFDPEISVEDDVEVRYNDELIFVGVIENIVVSESNAGISFAYSGRSVSGQLVGCSIEEISEFKNKKADYIIKKIIEPFEINVSFDGNVGEKIDKFSIETGEDPTSAITRLVNMKKLLAYDDAGELLVTESGSERKFSTISNEKFAASSTTSITEVFSKYKCVGNDNKISADVRNSNIKRYRPKTIISENKINKNTAKKIAEWQKQKDEGKKTTISVSGQGWLDENGEIYRINSVVSVDFINIRVSGNYLIKDVTYNYDNSGTRISMNLVNEDTYK